MNRFRTVKALLTLTALLTLGVASAQNQKITLPAARMTVVDAFSEILRQTGIGVAYSTDRLDPDRVIAFTRRELTVDEAVRAIIESAGVTHAYENRMILLTKAAEVRQVPEPVYENYAQNSVTVYTPPATTPLASPATRPIETVPAPVSLHGGAGNYTAGTGALPRYAVKTNLLYGPGTLTPNLSFEFATGPRTTVELGVSYNPWNLKGTGESNRKLIHMIVKPEFRYWLCDRFDGHFFGVHALWARYNIGTHRVPSLFDRQYRYNGHAVGAGVTYGYNLSLAARWNAEFAVGVGAAWLKYDRFDCATCNRDAEPLTKTYFGPTNASVSLVFLIR